jgi:hypothetical protein
MTIVIFGLLSGQDFYTFALALAKLSSAFSTHSNANCSYSWACL